jgi:hypothetical protein
VVLLKVSIKKKEKMLSRSHPYIRKQYGENFLGILTKLIPDVLDIICNYILDSEVHEILLEIKDPMKDFDFADFILETFHACIFQKTYLCNVAELFRIFFRKKSLEGCFRINSINSLEITHISVCDWFYDRKVSFFDDHNKCVYLNYNQFLTCLCDSGFEQSVANLIVEAVLLLKFLNITDVYI